MLCFDTNKEMFEKSRQSVRDNLNVLKSGGIVDDASIEGALGRISYTDDISVCSINIYRKEN